VRDRDNNVADSVALGRLEECITALRTYTVADLKVIEGDAIKKWLNAVIAAKEDLKGSRYFPQQKDVEGIIYRNEGLLLHLEDM